MSYNIDLMCKIAELYYYNELKQESIARRLKLSKYKVSRALKQARELGIVNIKINKPRGKTNLTKEI